MLGAWQFEYPNATTHSPGLQGGFVFPVGAMRTMGWPGRQLVPFGAFRPTPGALLLLRVMSIAELCAFAKNRNLGLRRRESASRPLNTLKLLTLAKLSSFCLDFCDQIRNSEFLSF